jgi:hypothetical protein
VVVSRLCVPKPDSAAIAASDCRDWSISHLARELEDIRVHFAS